MCAAIALIAEITTTAPDTKQYHAGTCYALLDLKPKPQISGTLAKETCSIPHPWNKRNSTDGTVP